MPAAAAPGDHAPRSRSSFVGSVVRLALLWAPGGGYLGLWAFFVIAGSFDPEADDLLPFRFAVIGFAVTAAIQTALAALEFALPRRDLGEARRAFVISLYGVILMVDALVIGFFWVIWGFGPSAGAGD